MSMSHVAGQPGAADAGASPEEFAQAFKQLEAELQAVPERDLLAVNLDVPSIVATALGAWSEIVQLRDAMREIPRFDAAQFDKLRSYALALGHAHAVYRAAAGPRDGVVELAEEVAQLRDVLQADAMALAKRGLLAEESVSKLRSGPGYKNLAFDVAGLVSLFRERWETVGPKTAVETAELERAGQLAQKLIIAVGVREQSPAAVGAAAKLRQKAFTLLVRAYDEVRRHVLFLRWHEGDADTIAPSLYAGRSGSRGTASSEAEPQAPAPGTDPPPTNPASPVASGVGAGLPIPPAAAVPAGLPGSSPIAR